MDSFYPINLNLKSKKTLVIGGGKVAERKIRSLLECGAKVFIVSPQITQAIEDMVLTCQVVYIPRGYAPIDLEGAFLVVSATDDLEVNKRVADDCFERNILVNVVDDPPNCNFFVPSVLRRGSFTVTISTEGKSPLLARRIREQLEKDYGEEYGLFLEIMGELRNQIIKDFPDPETRKLIFTGLVDSDILVLLREGKYEDVKERINCVLNNSWSKLQDSTS